MAHNNYLNSVDELSRLIHGYKNAEFRAKMIIKGLLQSSCEDNINPLCEQSIDVFEYIEKSTKTVLLGFLVTVQRVDSREGKNWWKENLW